MRTFKPYYAVIFTSTQTKHLEGYAEMAQQMEDLAKQQEGFLGMDTAKSQVGITISYW
ncbi:MAG: antibiotic biosynthesis monooxygenase, partial [Bacteroidota bacterium]